MQSNDSIYTAARYCSTSRRWVQMMEQLFVPV